MSGILATTAAGSGVPGGAAPSELVSAVFADLGLGAQARAAGWSLAVGSAPRRPLAAVTIERERLVFEAEPSDAPADAWKMLELNTELEGNVRYALPAASAAPTLIAEVDLRTIDLPASVAETIAGLTWQRDHAADNGDGGAGASLRTDVALEQEGAAGGLQALCHRAGWAVDACNEHRASIDLGADGAYLPCSIRIDGGEVIASVELLRTRALSPVARAAIGRLLLRAGAWLALVQPFVRRIEPSAEATDVDAVGNVEEMVVVAADLADEDRTGAEDASPQYVIGLRRRLRLPLAPAAEELDETLTALTLAARYTAAEVCLLGRDDTIAALLVERQQGSSSADKVSDGLEGLERDADGERIEARITMQQEESPICR